MVAILLAAWMFRGNTKVAVVGPAPAGAASSTTDSLASNNTPPVTHEVVVQKKSGTIVSSLSSITEGSQFIALLSSSGVTSLLTGKGPYTLFIPINEKFSQIPGHLTAAQQKRLVEYHVIAGKNIDVNIQQSGVIQALSQDMLNFSIRPGDKSARINSSVALQKFVTSNGTIYLIDQVLLPPLAAH